jgi:hypothetical protein
MTNSLTSKENASKQVRVFPRLTVTEAEAAIGAAVDGHGVTRVLSYPVERELKAGRLKVILEDFEPPPWPVNVIYPEARLSAAAVSMPPCLDSRTIPMRRRRSPSSERLQRLPESVNGWPRARIG